MYYDTSIKQPPHRRNYKIKMRSNILHIRRWRMFFQSISITDISLNLLFIYIIHFGEFIAILGSRKIIYWRTNMNRKHIPKSEINRGVHGIFNAKILFRQFGTLIEQRFKTTDGIWLCEKLERSETGLILFFYYTGHYRRTINLWRCPFCSIRLI